MSENNCKYPKVAEKFTKIKEEFCKNSNIRFAELTGISYAGLSAYCCGARNAGKDVLGRVLAAFPDLNEDWLILDKGEMRKSACSIQHNSGNQNCTITNVDNSTTAPAEVAELRSQLKSANETIHALTSMLSTKMTELQSSVDIINKLLNEESSK